MGMNMNNILIRVARHQSRLNRSIRLIVPIVKLAVAALLGLIFCQSALAVPTFARQTGQSCVACHAGGQYPELTPYGRMFKLTGYTMGEKTNPLSVMIVASATTTKNNDDGAGGSIVPQNGQPILDSASVFVAGKLTDNIGGFAQFTNSFLDSQDPTTGAWQGKFGADNIDIRYSDRTVDAKRDLVWGVSLHNNPTVQDVWNSAPAWSYPYMSTTRPNAFGMSSTMVEGGLAQQVAGIGAYFYLNKSFYAELTSYQTAKGALSFLSYGSEPGSLTSPLTQLDGNSPYWRLAYTHEWGAHNIMIGAFGLDAKVLLNDGTTGLPFPGIGSTHYEDVGFDAQYQYLLSPHTITATVRSVHEKITDNTGGQVYSDGPATLDTINVKGSYVYREKYGASLAYSSVKGSADATAYLTNAVTGLANVPDTERWTPEFFWIPTPNIRVGVQLNMYTKYMGGSNNYAGGTRNASDNDTTYLYFWTAF
jgi:hypothetical protein